jgi:ribose-phosphate pyrophosphokinase
LITLYGFNHAIGPVILIRFPAGEPHYELPDNARSCGYIQIDWTGARVHEVFDLLVVGEILRRNGIPFTLKIDYFPCSREDRPNHELSSFSLRVMCDLINSLKAQQVTIVDPHSDVTPALINNCKVIRQDEIFYSVIHKEYKNFVLVSPDVGALKKIYKLAQRLHSPVIECLKERNVDTGEITGIHIASKYPTSFLDKELIIVDDICDGGGTYAGTIEKPGVARILRNNFFTGSITLMTTHGLYSKGLQVFDGVIDAVYNMYGRVK